MNLDIEVVARNIKRYRKEKKYTQKELAAMIGKAHITVRKYETACIMPSAYSITIIAKVLGVSMSDIAKDK